MSIGGNAPPQSEQGAKMNNYDDTDAGGDMFFDFLKVVIAIFVFVLFAAALSGILWWVMT